MAELEVRDTELVLHLTSAERAESLHGDLRVPIASISAVEVLDDAHRAADILGVKAGTRIPGVIEVASVHGRSTIFAAVHHDTPRGVRVSLRDQPYDAWIVGCADPESVAATIPRHG